MEPISALSLVANVTQLVEQAIRVVKNCKEIYDRGSLEANDDIERFAKEVTEANIRLKDELATTRLSRRDKTLQELAEKSLQSSDELKAIVNQIKFGKSRPAGKMPVFRAWIRAALKRGLIEKLETQLREQERSLRSSLIKETLYVFPQHHSGLKVLARSLFFDAKKALALHG